VSRSCRANELIAAKLDSWNGEKVKRTRPSPAFRSLTLPLAAYAANPTSITRRCLCRIEHFLVRAKSCRLAGKGSGKARSCSLGRGMAAPRLDGQGLMANTLCG
jgi:hypothetical protein